MNRLLSLLTLLLCVAFLAGATAPVDTILIETDHIVGPAKAVVAVPEDYDTPGNDTRYPTVYLLHGYSDDYAYYSGKMNLAATATDYGVIIVCPDGRDSWYWDSPVNPKMQMESFIVEDLVTAVDSRYRTDARATSRAIAGLSMGGQGALWLAMRHPDIWHNAATMSGGVDITPAKFHKRWKMAKALGTYQSAPQRWKEHSIVNLAKTLEPGTIEIFICCGTEDFFYGVNCDLDRVLNERKIGHVYMTSAGNHSWNYWGRMIYPILDFFKVRVRSPISVKSGAVSL